MDTRNPTQELRIASWNLCLGLANKKDLVIDHLRQFKIAICALQETEIVKDLPENVLNCGDYNLELESNNKNKISGFYIRSDIKYSRRYLQVIIIDILCNREIQIINIYRSFRPPGLISPCTFLEKGKV